MLLDGYRIAGKSPRGRQTYVSLVCTPADRLVVVFRQWRRGVDTVFHGQAYDALCVQWLDPGGTWTGRRCGSPTAAATAATRSTTRS